jgi:hypothetical protein
MDAEYNFSVSLILLLLLGVGFGILVFFTNDRIVWGWSIALSLFRVALFWGPLHKFYVHQKWSIPDIIAAVLSLLLTIAYTAILLAAVYSSTSIKDSADIYFLLFWVCYFYGVLLLVYSLSYLKDCGFVLNLKSGVGLGLSLVFNMAGGGLAVWGLGSIPGAALIILAGYAYLGVAGYLLYVKLGGMHLALKIAVGVILGGTFIGIVVAAFVNQSSGSIFGFSVAYLVLAFSVLGTGLWFVLGW